MTALNEETLSMGLILRKQEVIALLRYVVPNIHALPRSLEPPP